MRMIRTINAPSTKSITGCGNRYDTSTAMKESAHVAKVNDDRTDERRRFSESLENSPMRSDISSFRASISSVVDSFLPDFEAIEAAEPYELKDDGGFAELLEHNRELVKAFREYTRAAERRSHRDSVEKVLSIAVAILSLAVSFVSLLGQFGVIG